MCFVLALILIVTALVYGMIISSVILGICILAAILMLFALYVEEISFRVEL